MTSIRVDAGRCELVGLCTQYAPDLFVIAEGADHAVMSDRGDVTGLSPAELELLVAICPSEAIVIAE